MAVKLTNQARHLLIVQLNDGSTVYLAPGETSGALDEAQLSGNERYGRMVREGLVASATQESAEAKGAAPPPAAPAPAAEAEDGAAEDETPTPTAQPESSGVATRSGAAVDTKK